MTAYYNENDPKAAEWLRWLILTGEIADGVVDSRSVEDVTPSDLKGFAQCHFFAGIGGWSYALRLAGWPDERPVWTGSCPCQPFSAAGKGAGFADERHLWPAWHWLISECRPNIIFGEQVANALEWLDLVSTDLEGTGYACGAAIMGAHSVGAPHIRQRLYWMAEPNGRKRDGRADPAGGHERDWTHAERSQSHGGVAANSEARVMAEPEGEQHNGSGDTRRGGRESANCSELDDPRSARLSQQQRDQGIPRAPGSAPEGRGLRGAPTGYWADCDWVACRDGKSRPVEPGTFPLAHGVPGRVGALRGYGNAIVPWVAKAFIEARI